MWKVWLGIVCICCACLLCLICLMCGCLLCVAGIAAYVFDIEGCVGKGLRYLMCLVWIDVM